ncbi:hypothetical protein ZWY2020_009986 [Hordeum vulgare]|nr:hypothetical protein ZWY2020_009986 [Hordeum vulgare]
MASRPVKARAVFGGAEEAAWEGGGHGEGGDAHGSATRRPSEWWRTGSNSAGLGLELERRDASGNVHTSEKRDDAHDSFLQVKKGFVLLTRMESITTYKNQQGQRRSGKKTKHVKRLKTKRLKLKVHFQMSKDTIFSKPHTKALCNANHRSIVEQGRATAAFQQRNSELSHEVNDLQDQLQAERANTQEIIKLERAEREQLEGKLKEERAERERLLEAERTSRLKFEKKNMMAKFAEFSKQMGTQQDPNN